MECSMTVDDGKRLIGEDEPRPVEIINAGGRSPFLLTGDHAGKRIPRRLNTLGVSATDRVRHIAWDIGVRALGEALATRFDATFVAQRYSRLVIDCNRRPDSADAIPEISDGTVIPGNSGLTASDRAARIDSLHRPYHDEISALLAERRRTGRDTIFIALHSFTPVMDGRARPWQVGILHASGEMQFACALLGILQRIAGLTVGDNEPYRMDNTDFSVPHHCFNSGLPYAEIEVRQDLIADVDGQKRWAALLGDALFEASRSVDRRG